MIQVIRRAEQARGAFDGGKILENKPIGFPQEGGKGRPVSSLFYWARAWSDGGGLIDRHPHEGFEIMSYVLKGDIEHFDSQLNGWKRLHAGDVQLIRAGNGIVHAERLLPGSMIFQIWFDPDLRKSLRVPASYNDYPAAGFPIVARDGWRVKVLKGPGAPVSMETEGIVMEEVEVSPGAHPWPLASGDLLAAYVLEGTGDLSGAALVEDDFVLASEEPALTLTVKAPARLFAIRAPRRPSYRTYVESRPGYE